MILFFIYFLHRIAVYASLSLWGIVQCAQRKRADRYCSYFYWKCALVYLIKGNIELLIHFVCVLRTHTYERYTCTYTK